MRCTNKTSSDSAWRAYFKKKPHYLFGGKKIVLSVWKRLWFGLIVLSVTAVDKFRLAPALYVRWFLIFFWNVCFTTHCPCCVKKTQFLWKMYRRVFLNKLSQRNRGHEHCGGKKKHWESLLSDWFSCNVFFPPVLHSHLLIHHRRYIILAPDSILK